MVDLNLLTNNKTNTNDTTNSLLIIGKANSEYKNKEITKCNSIEDAEYMYGSDSDLANAYKEAYDIGAVNIYLCNCYLITDYVSILKTLPNTEFSYITPLFNFSQTYTTNLNKEVYLSELYSNTIGDKLTQIIFTEMHASLYENIKQYINHMNSINTAFKQSSKNKLQYGDNFCFVLNCLEKYNFANVALASILIQSNLKYYPQKDIGDVVFDINNSDIYGQEMTYFAYNSLSKTTIENFLNYNKIACPEKFVPINLLVKKIYRALDFSNFSGKLFNNYMAIQIENKVNEIMDSFVEVLIESYKVKSINYSTSSNKTITVHVYLSIKPYNSIEEIDMKLEV